MEVLGQIIIYYMVAVDADNNKFYFGKNGTWAIKCGDPTSGSTGGYDFSATNHDDG